MPGTRFPRKTRATAALEAAEAARLVRESAVPEPPVEPPPDDWFDPTPVPRADLAARFQPGRIYVPKDAASTTLKDWHGRKVAWDRDEVIAAIRQYEGNLAMAAKMLGVNRQTLDLYRREQPEVQAVCREQWEVKLDNTESVLYNRALRGESWAVRFLLMTQGRARGYIERDVSLSMKLDLNALSDDQLKRIANGEHPAVVMGHPGGSPAGSPETGDDDILEGETRLLMGGAAEAEAGPEESGD
jgi:hypothetical protein